MSDQTQQNLRISDQGAEESVQQTPEAVKDGGVTATQPTQEIHGQAFEQAQQNVKTLSEPDMIAMNDGETVAEYKARGAQIQTNLFGFYDSAKEKENADEKVFEKLAKEAVEPIPALSPVLRESPYNSAVKLNVQITNVPDVSEGVKPEELLQYANMTFEAGAQAVRPVENYMAQQNAVTDSLLRIGPALDNAINYYANTAADQVVLDV